MIYEFGGFVLDASRRLLTREGEALPIAPKTFDLLLLLLDSGGRALSKAELLQALWPDTFVEEANLSFQISTLRKTLGEDGAKCIQTVPKYGYRFTGYVQGSQSDVGIPLDLPTTATTSKQWTGLWQMGGAATAAGILGLLVFLWSAEHMSPVSKDLTTVSPAVPLTAWAGHQQSPSLSPDGNQVAFAWDGPGSDNYDIYLKLVGPGEPIRLTSDPAIDEQPAWSPDGQSIAFFRFRSESHADIFVLPALGGAERKIASVNFWRVRTKPALRTDGLETSRGHRTASGWRSAAPHPRMKFLASG